MQRQGQIDRNAEPGGLLVFLWTKGSAEQIIGVFAAADVIVPVVVLAAEQIMHQSVGKAGIVQIVFAAFTEPRTAALQTLTRIPAKTAAETNSICTDQKTVMIALIGQSHRAVFSLAAFEKFKPSKIDPRVTADLLIDEKLTAAAGMMHLIVRIRYLLW
ncbi:MAG: hypothetical protein BWY83_01514 [bacterium ADurb.Bin478]|nr:MAG: hypothetical protein BWY83_01514 [bacterium ADurb.Bin478]